jgi:electron transport complex protein RnfB
MSENVYEELRTLLDRQPFGCPPGPGIIEFLQVLFSEEEAKVALGLTFAPLKVKVIAERAAVDHGDAARCLESLADKGAVYAREKDGVMRYALQPSIPMWEASFWKGIHNEKTREIARISEPYMPILMNGVGGPTTSFMRSIPIQEEIENETGALPYEKIYEFIDHAHTVSIAHCACRESRDDPNCRGPREACIMLDALADFVIERGFGRPITREEAKQKIREADEAGLVHMVSNWQDQLAMVCACCRCCCGVLRSLNEFGNRNIMTRSAFSPVRDPALCKACRVCADKRCPMSAIEITAEIYRFKAERCLGCGLCATGCPNDAISMKRTVEVQVPPANAQEWGLRLLMDHGRLEGFMELMTPKAKPIT